MPLFVSEFIRIDKLLNPCPVVKNDIKKSSIDNVKAIRAPVAMLPTISG